MTLECDSLHLPPIVKINCSSIFPCKDLYMVLVSVVAIPQTKLVQSLMFEELLLKIYSLLNFFFCLLPCIKNK